MVRVCACGHVKANWSQTLRIIFAEQTNEKRKNVAHAMFPLLFSCSMSSFDCSFSILGVSQKLLMDINLS